MIGAGAENPDERRGMALNEAVELAVNSCINEGILADILKKNRAEVCNLILYEYGGIFYVKYNSSKSG